MIVGAGLTVAGLWLVWPPAALIVSGIGLTASGLLVEVNDASD